MRRCTDSDFVSVDANYQRGGTEVLSRPIDGERYMTWCVPTSRDRRRLNLGL